RGKARGAGNKNADHGCSTSGHRSHEKTAPQQLRAGAAVQGGGKAEVAEGDKEQAAAGLEQEAGAAVSGDAADSRVSEATGATAAMLARGCS
ncbi:hypothetical protein QP330_10090, partial [Actinotignum timonense]|uniref:hypothetical protein n=1 Tax=Actinotignum timonense TaxID=1870995 RepID=UPI00254D1CE3|nr:hypothetical protein [Actinotignum timonense]